MNNEQQDRHEERMAILENLGELKYIRIGYQEQVDYYRDLVAECDVDISELEDDLAHLDFLEDE